MEEPVLIIGTTEDSTIHPAAIHYDCWGIWIQDTKTGNGRFARRSDFPHNHLDLDEESERPRGYVSNAAANKAMQYLIHRHRHKEHIKFTCEKMQIKAYRCSATSRKALKELEKAPKVAKKQKPPA